MVILNSRMSGNSASIRSESRKYAQTDECQSVTTMYAAAGTSGTPGRSEELFLIRAEECHAVDSAARLPIDFRSLHPLQNRLSATMTTTAPCPAKILQGSYPARIVSGRPLPDPNWRRRAQALANSCGAKPLDWRPSRSIAPIRRRYLLGGSIQIHAR